MIAEIFLPVIGVSLYLLMLIINARVAPESLNQTPPRRRCRPGDKSWAEVEQELFEDAHFG